MCSSRFCPDSYSLGVCLAALAVMPVSIWSQTSISFLVEGAFHFTVSCQDRSQTQEPRSCLAVMPFPMKASRYALGMS